MKVYSERRGIAYHNLNHMRVLLTVLAVTVGLGLAVIMGFYWEEMEGLYAYVTFPSKITEVHGELYAVIPSGMSETTIRVQSGVRVTIDGTEYMDGDEIDCAQWDDETVELCVWQQGNPFHYTGTLHFYCLDSLPTVSLSVQEGGLDYVKAQRGYTIQTTCATADENGIEDRAASGTLKVHGNTTWAADKRSYQVTMEEPTGLLGMDEAERWLLISNYADESGLLNLYAYTLQERLGAAYAPSCRQVNLYINGEYQGMYLLVHKINTGDEPMVELCGEYTYLEADQGMTTTRRYMRLRRPDGLDDDTLRAIEAYIEEAEVALYDETSSAFTQYFDLTSWAQQYLLQELMVNGDTELSSEYFRIVDGVFYAGPGWDYDRSFSAVMGDFTKDTQSLHVLGLKDDYMPSDTNAYGKLWLPELYQHAEFRDALENYYTSTFSAAAHALADELPTIIEGMSKSQRMDARMWHDEDGVTNAIDRALRWLDARLTFLDSYIGHEEEFRQEITIMDDGRFDVIYCVPK